MTATYREMKVRPTWWGSSDSRSCGGVTIDGRPLFTFCSEARARDAGRLEARRLDCAAAEARYLRGGQP